MHRGQIEAWRSTRRFVAVFAGWRSGKTVIGPWLLLREMQRNGEGDYAVLAPSFPMLENKARPELIRVLRQTLGQEGYHTSGNVIKITEAGQVKLWGEVKPELETRILLRHADNAEAIEAFDAKGIWVDEPGQIDGDEVREAIEARVSIGQYRIFYTSRPFKLNWYVREIWNRVMGKDGRRRLDADEQIEVVNFRSIDNPAFSVDEYERQRDRMAPWRFAMKFDGIPSKAAGVIFDVYTTVPREIPGADWQRAAGHDFGKLNNCGVWAYRHPERKSKEGKPQWVLYSTYLNGNRTANEHIESFIYGENPMDPDEGRAKRPPEKWRVGREQDEQGNWRPVAPLAWGGNRSNESDSRELYSVSGYPIAEPPIPGVQEGIETMYAMLKTEELVICEDLIQFIDDLDNYSNEIDEEGNPDEDKIANKSKWHRMDAGRYLCTGISRGIELSISRADGSRRAPDEPSRRESSPAERDIRRLRDLDGEEPSRVGNGKAKRGSGNLDSGQRSAAGGVRTSV